MSSGHACGYTSEHVSICLCSAHTNNPPQSKTRPAAAARLVSNPFLGVLGALLWPSTAPSAQTGKVLVLWGELPSSAPPSSLVETLKPRTISRQAQMTRQKAEELGSTQQTRDSTKEEKQAHCSALLLTPSEPATGWGTLGQRNGQDQGRELARPCSRGHVIARTHDLHGPRMAVLGLHLPPAQLSLASGLTCLLPGSQHRPVAICPGCLGVLPWPSALPGPLPHLQNPASLVHQAPSVCGPGPKDIGFEQARPASALASASLPPCDSYLRVTTLL